MGIEFEEGGTVLRILHGSLGQRPTKVLVWIIAGGIILAVARWVVENVEWFAQRFGWASFSWGTLLGTSWAVLLIVVMLSAFVLAGGLFTAITLRLGIDRLRSRSVKRMIHSFVILMNESKDYLPESKLDNIQVIINQAEELGKTSGLVRIINDFFGRGRANG